MARITRGSADDRVSAHAVPAHRFLDLRVARLPVPRPKFDQPNEAKESHRILRLILLLTAPGVHIAGDRLDGEPQRLDCQEPRDNGVAVLTMTATSPNATSGGTCRPVMSYGFFS
jgi:hypothetical protein